MHDMQWDDLYITPQEFLDILTVAAKDSMYFANSWDKPMHPEDLFYNMDSVMEGMGNGLLRYLALIGPKVAKRERDKRVPVFGGTLPKYEFNKPYTEAYYASNNVGDTA